MRGTDHHRIAQLESLNHELMRLIREFKQLTDHPEVAVHLQRDGNQLYEIALTLEEVRASGLTMDQWMGRYLLGAKAEAKRVVTEALSLAPILKEPETKGMAIHEPLANQNVRLSSMVDNGYVETPLTRLSEVAERYQTQCDALLSELADTVDSPLGVRKEDV